MMDPALLNDVDFLDWCLRQGPHTTNQVLAASFRVRGCGLTPHSRAADLRRKLLADGLTVECRPAGKNPRTGRQEWEYSLVPLTARVVIEPGGQVALAV